MRKWGIIAFATVCVLAAIGFRLHQKPQDARGAFYPPPPGNHTAVGGLVASLPGSVPLMYQTNGRWKAVAVTTPSGFDMGLGYEAFRLKVKKGPLELPELTGDFILTPDRLGAGGSVSLTDYLDLEAGVSRRHDTGEGESYVGVGVHLRF